MKYTQLHAFEKHLEGTLSKGAPLYFIIVKDSFERKAATDRLISALQKGKGELAVRTCDAEKLVIEEVLSELNTLSFFSEKVHVHITNGEKLTKPAMSALESYFVKPNPSACLIISAAAINHATNFYKKGEKNGIVLEIEEEKPWEVEKSFAAWIRQEVLLAGKSISPPALQQLQKQGSKDRGEMHGEIQKLVCYSGDRSEITLQDIQDISTSVNTENNWQLGDAIFQRDAASALRITKALLEEGVALLALIRQIRTQVQVKYQICSIMSTGGTPADVSSSYPYMKGQILERNINMATAYGMERFKKALLKIDHTEVQAKNSQADDGLLAELLIAHLTR